jgi:DNA-binding NarL/FixJ family response regulator
VDKPKTTLALHTLLLCADVQFLGATRGVLNQLQVTPKLVSGCEEAMAMIQAHEFDLVVVDWREIHNLGEFLSAVRRSKLNRECVLVAIVRDLLDLRQAFAAGVHFLIHKPASTVQIERCLRAAYGATVARRRKQHREAVNIVAVASTRSQPYVEVTVANLSEGGAGVRFLGNGSFNAAHLSAGEDLDLRFVLPESGEMLHTTGTVVWTTPLHAGIRFTFIPHNERVLLESWLTCCVERSLAELCERLQAICA